MLFSANNNFDSLKKIGDVASGAPGPGDAYSVHLEGRRHHVQSVAVPFAASNLVRVVVHPETDRYEPQYTSTFNAM